MALPQGMTSSSHRSDKHSPIFYKAYRNFEPSHFCADSTKQLGSLSFHIAFFCFFFLLRRHSGLSEITLIPYPIQCSKPSLRSIALCPRRYFWYSFSSLYSGIHAVHVNLRSSSIAYGEHADIFLQCSEHRAAKLRTLRHTPHTNRLISAAYPPPRHCL